MTNLQNNPFLRQGTSIAGKFVKNSNAEIPKAISYAELAKMQNDLHVPQTGPSVPMIGNSTMTDKVSNGMRILSFKNPHGDWNDAEIMSPPEEFLAKNDLRKQEAERKKQMDNLTDEQKRLLAMVDAGLINSPSRLKEES